MAKYRRGRINDSVAQEISVILRDVKDPRVSSALITITGAEVTADLKYAKVFYSVYGDNDKELQKGIKCVIPFIRSQLAHRLNLRITPELNFVFDDSAKNGVKISSILNSLNVKSAEEIAAIKSSCDIDNNEDCNSEETKV